MKIANFTEGCGVIVSDVQLSTISDQDLLVLKAAFVEHGLLFFRDQALSPDEHLEFAKRWGRIVVNNFFNSVPGYPDIAEVKKERNQVTNIGGGWHTDHSYDEIPAKGSILVARKLPRAGGDTHFANLCKAYEGLSPALQERLLSLRATHSNRHLYGEQGYYRTTDMAQQLKGSDRVGDATHPVVITLPESGRRALYVNPGHTVSIEGWDSDASQQLLALLYDHVSQPQYTCAFDWKPGSIAFWDNRSTWHFAQNDYHGDERLMHRITLAGSALSAANA